MSPTQPTRLRTAAAAADRGTAKSNTVLQSTKEKGGGSSNDLLLSRWLARSFILTHRDGDGDREAASAAVSPRDDESVEREKGRERDLLYALVNLAQHTCSRRRPHSAPTMRTRKQKQEEELALPFPLWLYSEFFLPLLSRPFINQAHSSTCMQFTQSYARHQQQQ